MEFRKKKQTSGVRPSPRPLKNVCASKEAVVQEVHAFFSSFGSPPFVRNYISPEKPEEWRNYV